MLMSDRDNLVRNLNRNDFPKEGLICNVQRTVEHGDYPAGAKKKVRMESRRDTIFEMTGDGEMKLTISMASNPNGSVPTAVINKMAGKMPAGMIDSYRAALVKLV